MRRTRSHHFALDYGTARSLGARLTAHRPLIGSRVSVEARQRCWEMGLSDPRVGQGRAEDAGLVRDAGAGSRPQRRSLKSPDYA